MSEKWRKKSSKYTQAENIVSRHDGTELAGNDGKMRRGSGCFSRSLPMATNSFTFTFYWK